MRRQVKHSSCVILWKLTSPFQSGRSHTEVTISGILLTSCEFHKRSSKLAKRREEGAKWESPASCLFFRRPPDQLRWESLQVGTCENPLFTCRSMKIFSTGTTIAVDIYVWLHKGAFRCLTLFFSSWINFCVRSCAEALAQGRPTDAYVKYVMRWILLQ